jgi:xanthine dehydrogenase small subunit
MGQPIRFILNHELVTTDEPPGSSVLDFVRSGCRLVGTKVGCREGDCGACTVLVGRLDDGQVHYEPMTSCLMPLGNAGGKHVVTIEGLNTDGLTPVQQAIADEGATQCGFCTVGFVVSLTGFCLQGREPSPAAAIAAIDGNICRCTGYKSLERAAAVVAAKVAAGDSSDRVGWLVGEGFVPPSFAAIPERLQQLEAELEVERTMARRTGPEHQLFIGGGTDLVVQQPEQVADLEVDLLLDAPALKGIREEGGRIVLGASTTASELCDSLLLRRYLPRLADHLKLVASTPIRAMATIGGNFANASPIGDLTILFLALDSRIVLSAGDRRRELALKELYRSYKTLDKRPEERIESVSFAVPTASTALNFEKVSKRTYLDIASVNSALRLEVEDGIIAGAGLSAGGVAPIPLFLTQTTDDLVGRPVDADTARRAAELAAEEIAPISDVRGSAEYKRLLVRQLVLAHFLTLFPTTVRLEALR